MITYYYRSVKEDSLRKIPKCRPGTWVHVEKPSSEELDQLAEEFSLNRDLLKDATDIYEVPRFESEDGIAYFFTRFPHRVGNELGTATILFAVTSTVVVTVSVEHSTMFDPYIENKKPLFTTQRTKLFLLLISVINKTYRDNFMQIRREVQRSRVHLHKIRNKDIVLLVGLESALNDFISALLPSFTAIQTILSGTYVPLFEEDKDIIEDIQLENQQHIETAKSNLKTIQNIRSAYTAIVTNDLNSVIKLLTSLTIILTIPTILGSLFGMNVPLPYTSSPHAFLIIVLIALGSMGVAAFIFIRRDWM